MLELLQSRNIYSMEDSARCGLRNGISEQWRVSREREGGREGELKPLTVQYNMQIRLHYIDVSAYAQLCARGREREREYECDCVCVCVWQHV